MKFIRDEIYFFLFIISISKNRFTERVHRSVALGWSVSQTLGLLKIPQENREFFFPQIVWRSPLRNRLIMKMNKNKCKWFHWWETGPTGNTVIFFSRKLEWEILQFIPNSPYWSSNWRRNDSRILCTDEFHHIIKSELFEENFKVFENPRWRGGED